MVDNKNNFEIGEVFGFLGRCKMELRKMKAPRVYKTPESYSILRRPEKPH